MTVTVATLRRGFLGLAAAGIVGTSIELALTRHWTSAVQLIPWYTLGALAVAVVLVALRPRPAVVRVVRVLAILAVLSAGVGIYEHVLANYDAAPLDFRYTDRWAAMSFTSRWWAAISESVGPAPTLAPAVLAQAGVCLLFATLGLPSGTADNVQRTPSRAKASSSS